MGALTFSVTTSRGTYTVMETTAGGFFGKPGKAAWQVMLDGSPCGHVRQTLRDAVAAACDAAYFDVDQDILRAGGILETQVGAE